MCCDCNKETEAYGIVGFGSPWLPEPPSRQSRTSFVLVVSVAALTGSVDPVEHDP
jgi:hypothetical protein